MAKWPYSTARWQRLRQTKLTRDPLCQYHSPAIVKAATEVDHWQAIEEGGDPFAWANLASACRPCHSRKTALCDGSFGRAPSTGGGQRGVDPDTGLPLDAGHWWNEGSLALPHDVPRSQVPLHMVCGPSGSGKTTYVRDHAGDGDCVIDLDAIRAELSGRRWYEAGDKWLAPALQRRNDMLRGLASSPAPAAWFIVSAPSAAERRDWARMLRPVETVVLAVPLDICVARLQADDRRARSWGYFAMLARRWWLRYAPSVGDTVVENNLSALRAKDRGGLHTPYFAGI